MNSLNHLGILLVHLAALYVVVLLWRHAPDIVQKFFLLACAGTMLVYLFADALALYGIDNRRGGVEFMGISALWEVKSVAGAVAHGALLVYLVRQWWIKTEACKTLKEQRQ